VFLWRSQSWGGDVQGLLVCSGAQWLSWTPQQGKTLKLLWATSLAPNSCCSVTEEAGVALWAGCLLKG